MDKTRDAITVYPNAIGDELENGFQLLYDGKEVSHEPFTQNLHRHIPKGILGHSTFMLNGSRIYMDGPAGIETATPECDGPDELVVYELANERVLDLMVDKFFRGMPRDMRRHYEVRSQKRVIDSNSNRKGAHDNFGYESGAARMYTDSYYPPSIPDYLATRSFMTGAGLTSPSGLQFAQKVGGIGEVYGYGYHGYMFRTTTDEGGNRIEFRCGDANISPWAIRARVGSGALLLALNQIPETRQIINRDSPGKFNFIAYASEMNDFELDPENQMVTVRGLARAVGFNRSIAELALEKLPRYKDMPKPYREIAAEIIRYCDDFERVRKGEAHFGILADRADWAAKFKFMQAYFERHGDSAEQSWGRFTCNRAIELDLLYDIRHFVPAEDDTVQFSKYGYGFALRDRGAFAYEVPDDTVAAACYAPPQTTRAKLRTEMIRNYEVESSDWHKLAIRVGSRTVWQTYASVRTTELSAKQIAELKKPLPNGFDNFDEFDVIYDDV